MSDFSKRGYLFIKGIILRVLGERLNGIQLYLGKYEVKEITAPYGYELSEEIHVAELLYAGQEISVTETAVSAYNERQTATLPILKMLETNDLCGEERKYRKTAFFTLSKGRHYQIL